MRRPQCWVCAAASRRSRSALRTEATAILVTLCREPPEPVARHLVALRKRLGPREEIFVLSDTYGAEEIAREEAAFAPLLRLGAVAYRRRASNAGRKPGNIADWARRHAARFDHMLILDADSRMSAGRIAAMIARMEREPQLGLLQAGIGLVPGPTRFARAQRTSVRLLAPVFCTGFARWSGDAGNYWGHNALIRTRAWKAASLPRLSGRPPFGGDVLSHDFVEAAFIRRAGWRVALSPSLSGSAEDGPHTLSEFHRRDRRWCQGNLQHARLVGAPGLHPLSRLHMACGMFAYLAAPVWLALFLLTATGAVVLDSALPLALVAVLLVAPKFCGLARLLGRRATPRRRRVALRAAAGELAASAVLAPLLMVRQTISVLAVFAGRDCGWKSAARRGLHLPHGMLEATTGAGLAWICLALNPAALPWLAPVVLPLLAAPLMVPWLEAEP